MLHDLLNCCRKLIPEAKADTAQFSAIGANLTPVADQLRDIEMRSECVEIDVFRSQATVQAHFELVNLGSEVTIEIGFPMTTMQKGSWVPLSQVRNFEAFSHRGQIAEPEDPYCSSAKIQRTWPRYSRNRLYSFWRTWSQQFAESETVHVYIRYRLEMISYGPGSPMPVSYVLRTGKFWHGLISSATVTLTCHEFDLDTIIHASPEPDQWDNEKNRLSWHWQDLDPEEDICVAFSPGRIIVHEILQKIQKSPVPTNSASTELQNLNLQNYPIIDPFELLSATPVSPRKYWRRTQANQWPVTLPGQPIIVYGCGVGGSNTRPTFIWSERMGDYNLFLDPNNIEMSQHDRSKTTLKLKVGANFKFYELSSNAVNQGNFRMSFLFGQFTYESEINTDNNKDKTARETMSHPYFLVERLVIVKLKQTHSPMVHTTHPWTTAPEEQPPPARSQVNSKNDIKVLVTRAKIPTKKTWLERVLDFIFGH